MEKLIDLNIEVEKCKGCGLCKNKHIAPLFFEQPKYVMVFETPLFYIEQNELLHRFYEVFRAKGFSKDDFLLISTVQCLTERSKRNGRDYKHSSPAKMHRDCCSQWVDKYFKAVKPKAVIAFGNLPMEELTGSFDGITKKHNTVVTPKIAGRTVKTILSLPPSAKNLDEIAKIAETLKSFAID